MPLPALLLTLAAAQAVSASPPIGPHRFARTFISPMGEPFRPTTRGEDALADWFRQADLNRDGQITADEMQADADRFFGELDTSHDGEIDPDELTHYEEIVAPEIRTSSSATFIMPASVDDAQSESGHGGYGRGGGGGGGGGNRGGHGGGGGHGGQGGGGGGPEGYQGASRFGLLDLPEPVIAADTDFNRGVSKEEFRKAARQRFTALDVDHRGRLTLAVLETVVPPPPPRPNKPDNSDAAPAESQESMTGD
jgi:Ca2+-binding EF-hand superfamily protein